MADFPRLPITGLVATIAVLYAVAAGWAAVAETIDFSTNASLDSLFPSGWDTGASSCDSEAKMCTVRYPAGSNNIVAGVIRFSASDEAQAKLDPSKSAGITPPADNHPISGFGDKAVELTSYKYNDGETYAFEEIMFSKGCYLVQVGLDAATHQDENGNRIADPPTSSQVSRIHEIATFVDSKLAALGDCQTNTIVNIRNPKTGTWIPWLLVPGIGLVLLGGIQLGGSKAPQPTDPSQPTNPEQDSKQYYLDIRTQDNRVDLNTDGEDIIWIYAQVRCSQPDVDTTQTTEAITFGAEGPDAEWLHLGTPRMKSEFKTLPVRAWPPSADAELDQGKATVAVTAVIEGAPAQGRVELDLDDDQLEIF